MPLLSAAGVRYVTRSATGIAARAVRGFQVFRLDGYSWTTTIPGGERITSEVFNVGGSNWCVDYYPNGASTSSDSDSISLHLRLHASGYGAFRVRAQFKFSLLDLAGAAAYEVPPVTSTFSYAGRESLPSPSQSLPLAYCPDPEGTACGHAEFISRAELERRRDVLLRDDCLAILCDVGVVQLDRLAVAPKEKARHARHDSDDDSDGEESRRRWQPMDDDEFVRRSLDKNRGA